MGHDGNRVPLRLSVRCAPAKDKRSRWGSFPAALSPFPHPPHLPIPYPDVVVAFSIFPSTTERAMACGAFENNWLVIAHRVGFVSEEG